VQENITDETTEVETTADDTNTANTIEEATTADEPTKTTEVDSSTELEVGDQLVEYSLNVNNEVITLFDWDDDIDLYKLFGDPINEDIRKLGEGSDTFRGSFIKTLKYEGLEIRLFSPPDNGKTFWILDIKVSSNSYSTSRGIKIGDSLETLKNRYPSITKVLDGRTDDNNCAYEIADWERYLFLQFEVTDGIIQQIHIFHLIP
ncbi:MAG TPA: hypothetical protein VIH13_05190, partial [Candidatus Hydromicrobium sp.]